MFLQTLYYGSKLKGQLLIPITDRLIELFV